MFPDNTKKAAGVQLLFSYILFERVEYVVIICPVVGIAAMRLGVGDAAAMI